MTPVKHRSCCCDFDKELQMHTYKLCIQLCTTIYKTYGVPQTTYYIQCDILLCTICLLCIPYHKHYMQHTTHSFLYKYRMSTILQITYYILCTIYYVLDTRREILDTRYHVSSVTQQILYTVYSVLHIIYCILCIMCTLCQILDTRY